jgi:hypothetical protein
MNTAIAFRRFASAASVITAVASAPAVAQSLPPALDGKLIYAAPARVSTVAGAPEADIATYDVFIDGRTGFAFVRTPRGWTFIRDIRRDAAGDARAPRD